MTEPRHPLRRADDTRDPRVDVVLTHLEYMRDGLDSLNAKVATQNGRVYATERELVEMRTKAAAAVEEATRRAGEIDRNIKIVGALVTLVGLAVTAVQKLT